MRLRSLARFAVIMAPVLVLGACAPTIPKEALQLSPESLQRRQMQSRYFDTNDEAFILSASAGVLQDLGFNLDESETDLGLIVASKMRDARETGQIVGSVLMGIFLGADVPFDTEQKIRASLVTRPSGTEGGRIGVRVTFQRIVWNSRKVARFEAVDEPEIYREFFDRLSKSVFLQANLS